MLAITHPPILQFVGKKEKMKEKKKKEKEIIHLESHMLETCLVFKV